MLLGGIQPCAAALHEQSTCPWEPWLELWYFPVWQVLRFPRPIAMGQRGRGSSPCYPDNLARPASIFGSEKLLIPSCRQGISATPLDDRGVQFIQPRTDVMHCVLHGVRQPATPDLRCCQSQKENTSKSCRHQTQTSLVRQWLLRARAVACEVIKRYAKGTLWPAISNRRISAMISSHRISADDVKS